jgi:hypothetical protein
MSYLLRDTTVRVYTRTDWDARPPRAMNLQPSAPTEAFVHHSADPRPEAFDRLAEQKAHMRAIQDFHMDVRGWSDIAYHLVVFQPYGNIDKARIFEGRSWSYVPAAQEGHNTGTLAVCAIGDFRSDELKRNTRYAIGRLLISHDGAHAIKVLAGHRDVDATDCPGDKLYRWIPRIADAADLRVHR